MVRVNQLGSNIGVVVCVCVCGECVCVGSACVWGVRVCGARVCVCGTCGICVRACIFVLIVIALTHLFSRLRNIVRLGHGFVYAGRVTRRVVEWKRRRRWQFRFECRRFVHDPPPTAALETARATSSSHHGVARQPGLLRLPRFAGLENLQLYRSGA